MGKIILVTGLCLLWNVGKAESTSYMSLGYVYSAEISKADQEFKSGNGAELLIGVQNPYESFLSSGKEMYFYELELKYIIQNQSMFHMSDSQFNYFGANVGIRGCPYFLCTSLLAGAGGVYNNHGHGNNVQIYAKVGFELSISFSSAEPYLKVEGGKFLNTSHNIGFANAGFRFNL